MPLFLHFSAHHYTTDYQKMEEHPSARTCDGHPCDYDRSAHAWHRLDRWSSTWNGSGSCSVWVKSPSLPPLTALATEACAILRNPTEGCALRLAASNVCVDSLCCHLVASELRPTLGSHDD